MVIEVKCPCGKTLRANESLIGQTIQCNLCRREVLVPDPQAAPPEPLHKEPPPPVADNKSPWEYAYWLLALAFFPLAISLAQPDDKIKDRFEKALNENPDVKKRLGDLGAQIVSAERTSPGYLGAFVKSEIEKWAAPIKASGARVE